MNDPHEPVSVYGAPTGVATAELRDRGSRFLAVLAPVRDEIEARERLASLRAEYSDATHHCWGWRLGLEGVERSSDDGEPAGTAGRPIVQVLRGAPLSDVLAVVVRWYGGTKLGKGGLARAYAGAVKLALAELVIEERWPTTEIEVVLPYDRVGALKRLVHPPEVKIVAEDYGEVVTVRLVVRSDRIEALTASLAAIGANVSGL